VGGGEGGGGGGGAGGAGDRGGDEGGGGDGVTSDRSMPSDSVAFCILLMQSTPVMPGGQYFGGGSISAGTRTLQSGPVMY